MYHSVEIGERIDPAALSGEFGRLLDATVAAFFDRHATLDGLVDGLATHTSYSSETDNQARRAIALRLLGRDVDALALLDSTLARMADRSNAGIFHMMAFRDHFAQIG